MDTWLLWTVFFFPGKRKPATLTFSLSSTRSGKSGTRHTLPISLLILRKKPTVLQSTMGLPKFKYEKKNKKDSGHRSKMMPSCK